MSLLLNFLPVGFLASAVFGASRLSLASHLAEPHGSMGLKPLDRAALLLQPFLLGTAIVGTQSAASCDEVCALLFLKYTLFL